MFCAGLCKYAMAEMIWNVIDLAMTRKNWDNLVLGLGRIGREGGG